MGMRLQSLRVLPTRPVVAASLRPGSGELEPLAFASKAWSPSERPPPDSSALVPLPGHRWFWAAIASRSSEASSGSSCSPTPSSGGPPNLRSPGAWLFHLLFGGTLGALIRALPRVSVSEFRDSRRPCFLSPDPRSKEDLTILLFVGCQGSARFSPLPESLLTVTSNVKLFLLVWILHQPPFYWKNISDKLY